jgi:hypothetical protein
VGVVESLPSEHAWVAAIGCTPASASDGWLARYTTRLHRAYARDAIVFEGSCGLSPWCQSDIDALVVLSPRFLRSLLLATLSLLGMCTPCFLVRDWPGGCWLVMGAGLLSGAAIHMDPLRNALFLRQIGRPRAMMGAIMHPRWRSNRLSAAETVGVGALFAFSAPPYSSWSLHGGAISCCATAAHPTRWAAWAR